MNAESIESRKNRLIEMITSFCDDKLDKEYKDLCIKLINKLSRKKNVPFLSGKLEIWAGAIIYALGQINFLFDQSSKIHLKPDDICYFFNTSKSTTSQKAKIIRDMLKLDYFNEDFSLEYIKNQNPLKNYQSKNGFIVPKETSNSKLLSDIQIEKKSNKIRHIIDQQNFQSVEEANIFLKNLEAENNSIDATIYNDPKFLSEEMVYDAYENSPKEGIKMVKKALEIYPDNVLAFLYLEKQTKDKNEKLSLLEKALKAGERSIGETNFQKWKGGFWNFTQTRPYMRAKCAYADLLFSLDRREEAAKQYKEMLILNNSDNQGIRYLLAPTLISLDRVDEYKDLLKQFPSEIGAHWFFTYALYLFKYEGDNKTSRKALTKALESNVHVLEYLFQVKKVPENLTDHMGFGDESEAFYCVVDIGFIYYETKGALDWVLKFMKDTIKSD